MIFQVFNEPFQVSNALGILDPPILQAACGELSFQGVRSVGLNIGCPWELLWELKIDSALNDLAWDNSSFKMLLCWFWYEVKSKDQCYAGLGPETWVSSHHLHCLWWLSLDFWNHYLYDVFLFCLLPNNYFLELYPEFYTQKTHSHQVSKWQVLRKRGLGAAGWLS